MNHSCCCAIIKTFEQVMAHVFNPSLGEAKADESNEFEVNLAYRGSSRTVRIYIETVSLNKKKKNNSVVMTFVSSRAFMSFQQIYLT